MSGSSNVKLKLIITNNYDSMDNSAQVSADYIVGISVFMLSITFVFLFLANVSAVRESNKNQYISEVVAEIVLNEIRQEDAYFINAVNMTKLDNLDLDALLGQRSYHVNITVRNLMNSSAIIKLGDPAPEIEDYGYVERVIFNYKNPSEIYILEVRVW